MAFFGPEHGALAPGSATARVRIFSVSFQARGRMRSSRTIPSGICSRISMATSPASGVAVGIVNCSERAARSCSSVMIPRSTRFLPRRPP